MKQTILIMLVILLTGLNACQKENTTDVIEESSKTVLSKAEARSWFDERYQITNKKERAGKKTLKGFSALDIPWENFTSVTTDQSVYGLVGLAGQPKVNGYLTGYRKLLITKSPTDSLSAYILEIVPDALYLQTHKVATRRDFYGRVFFFDEDYQLVRGFVYENGKVTGEIKPTALKEKRTNNTIRVDLKPITETCTWNEDNFINAEGEIVAFAQKNCSYSNNSDNLSNGNIIPPGGDYTGGGGGSGGSSDSAPPVSDLPDENKSKIDPAAYMKCFGSLPDAGSKMTVTVYVQEPAPGLPFNIGPNSVGHTAIGLTKTYKGQLITQVVGFYPDASGKDKMHAPSRILDNGGLAYTTSISYTIIASDFAKITRFISTPPGTYDLTKYNCTSFVNDACLAGGIKLPDPNGNMGLGTTGMMPAALGSSIRQVGNAGNTNVNGGVVEKNHGPCN